MWILKQALILIGLSLASAATAAQPASSAESASRLARWQRQARAVTVTRDDWGIAHVRGGTDAEAVFGMIYAQAEDDFNRVETNYLDGARPHRRGRGRERASTPTCGRSCSSTRKICRRATARARDG